MNSIHHLSFKQLLQAADLKERIAGLENQLQQLLETKTARIAAFKTVVKKGGISAAGKARIVAAQKLRWAKINAAKAKTAPVAKLVPATTKPAKKFTMSAASKAEMALRPSRAGQGSRQRNQPRSQRPAPHSRRRVE